MRLHSLPYQQSGRFGSGTAAQASSGSSVASSAADRPVAGWFAAAATADLRRCPLSPSPAAGTAAAAAAGAAAAAAAGAAAAGSAPKSSRRVGEPLSTSRCPELTPLAAVRGGSLKSRRRRARSPASSADGDRDRARLGVRCGVARCLVQPATWQSRKCACAACVSVSVMCVRVCVCARRRGDGAESDTSV